MKTYSIIIFTLFVFSCKSNDTQNQIVQKPSAPLQKGENSSSFNQYFKNLLNGYITLTDAFTNENKNNVDSSTKNLKLALDSLKIEELKADSNIISNVNILVQSMLAESNALLQETELIKKRKAYQIISEQMYLLVTVVQYNECVIYHYQCANAFTDGDTNGTWLSLTKQKNNPYQPSNTSCVTLLDSLNFK